MLGSEPATSVSCLPCLGQRNNKLQTMNRTGRSSRQPLESHCSQLIHGGSRLTKSSLAGQTRAGKPGSATPGREAKHHRRDMKLHANQDLDFTRFRRHISAGSYRTFVTVGNWPKLTFAIGLVVQRHIQHRAKASVLLCGLGQRSNVRQLPLHRPHWVSVRVGVQISFCKLP